MRDLLSLYMSHNGMEVTAVATAQQAKEQFCQAPFDLTILDLNLAGVNSVDVLNFINHKDPKHPVIIYTGVDEDELLMKKSFLGHAVAVVRKMSPMSTLLAEIRHQLAESSQAGEAPSEPVPRP